MHALFKCQIFGDCEGNLRCDQTLDDRIVCQIDKHGNMVQNAALAEGTFKIFGHIVLDAHSCEYDGEFFIGIVSQRGLHDDLRCQLVVGKSVSGKDRELLSADQGHQTVNGGDTGTDVVTRIFTGHRV